MKVLLFILFSIIFKCSADTFIDIPVNVEDDCVIGPVTNLTLSVVDLTLSLTWDAPDGAACEIDLYDIYINTDVVYTTNLTDIIIDLDKYCESYNITVVAESEEILGEPTSVFTSLDLPTEFVYSVFFNGFFLNRTALRMTWKAVDVIGNCVATFQVNVTRGDVIDPLDTTQETSYTFGLNEDCIEIYSLAVAPVVNASIIGIPNAYVFNCSDYIMPERLLNSWEELSDEIIS